MQAATILPQSYLPMIREEKYHLALAHLMYKDGFEQYTGFYEAICKRDDTFVILDNGLIEGDPRPISELVDKAYEMRASELVLPDVFQDKNDTIREVQDALDFCMSHAAGLRTMAVPQGSTYEEWLECARYFCTLPIHTIAIPKVVTKMAGRDGRLMALLDLQEHLGSKDVHLLGCWESPLELKVIENHVRSGQIKPVRGVDSAIAYVYARAGLRMSEAERPSGAIDFNAEDADSKVLAYNIEMWKAECAALPMSPEKIQRLW